MPVSDSYRTYVLEQLGRVTQRIRSKSMFGGVGVYSGDHFFALLDNDMLFFKVDDATRPDFVAAKMRAWSPFEDGREAKGYYQLPEELLEDPDELRPWVEKAVAVAARKKKPKKSAKPKRR
ncbi:MAG TPA: TfoX/Sxy family protein [Gemmatimonadaceae bacterium]|jgi:DNA transformation protein|nr:TfoX/Sxy family protein [Gemmatimonadaceae bacterium]